MIVIDSSAMIAILNAEPERVKFLRAIESSDGCVISAVTILETRMVLRGRFGAGALADLDARLLEFQPEIAVFDEVQAGAAFAAFELYGKGMHGAARLNLGDCVSYALAKSRSLPLLFKGQDFSATDIVSAI